PHRMGALLSALVERVPESTISVARELTKRHEEVLVGSAAEVASQLSRPRGEFTVVISGIRAQDGSDMALDVDALVEAGRDQGLSDRSLVAMLRAAGVGRRDAYSRLRS